MCEDEGQLADTHGWTGASHMQWIYRNHIGIQCIDTVYRSSQNTCS